MRPAPKPPISPHRLARLTRWMRLWLKWFAWAFFTCFPPNMPRTWRASAEAQLDIVTKTVRDIVFLHACARMPPLKFHAVHRYGRYKRRGERRAIIGSALRKAVRGKGFRARIAAIIAVMEDIERHIVRLARRLRKGLTRMRVIVAQRGAAMPCPAAAWLSRTSADTS